MKCFLCGLKFDHKVQLEHHYRNFHKVNPENKFYKELINNINKKNCYLFQKCLRCSELIPTSKYKVIHNFLQHYNEGNQELAETKPINIEDNILFTKYSIDVKKFGKFYNFYDSEEIISEFLNNVRSKFQVENEQVIIKGSCVIENIQQSISDEILPITDTRYWSTETYTVYYFNQFVYYNLAQDYSKRVINNGLTGSSWVFNRFINLTLNVLKKPRVIT